MSIHFDTTYHEPSTSTDEVFLTTIPCEKNILEAADGSGNVVLFNAYQHTMPHRKRRRLLQATTSKMEFAASNADETKDKHKYLIGIFNRKQKTLELTDTTFLNFQQKIRFSEKLSSPISETNSQSDFKAMMEAKAFLGQTFGNRKIQQRIRVGERNQLELADLESLGQQIEGSVLKRAEMSILRKEANEGDESSNIRDSSSLIDRLLPAYNADTKNISEIYPISELITFQEEADISVDAITSLNSIEDLEFLVQKYHLPEYVTSHIKPLLGMAFLEKDIRQLQWLVYLTFLIRFFHVRPKDWLGSAHHPLQFFNSKYWQDIPHITQERFIELFTEASTDTTFLQPSKILNEGMATENTSTIRILSSRMKDKLVSYILILCLHIDAFSLPLSVLARDLKLGLTQMTTYAKSVGCKVTTSGSEKIAHLHAPLSFPSIRVKRQKN